MSLVYRAVWDDLSAEPIAVLDDEFKDWCRSKGIDPDDVPYRGRHESDSGIVVEVRRGEVEYGRALQCCLTEADPRERTWTMRATAMADARINTFWVDLDCHDPHDRPVEMAAPRLVRGLIQNGGEPTSFGLPLRVEAWRIGPANVSELLEPLLDPERRAPFVVFSPHLDDRPELTLQRADATAGALAGVAHVFSFRPAATQVIDDALPQSFRVYGGAVRLYLPGMCIDDPDDADRHRWIPRQVIKAHPRRAASLLASRLARLQIHQPIPEVWERLRGLLRQPTQNQIGDRAAAITNQRPGLGMDITALRKEIDDLTALLAESELLRATAEKEASIATQRLERAVAEEEERSYDDAAELEALRSERDALQRNLRQVGIGTLATTADAAADPHDLAVPETVEAAIEQAREHLPNIVIPDEALRDIDEFSSTPKYEVWGSAAWQALLALNDYAALKQQGERPAGFYTWSAETNAWPVNKLAMTESETVEQSSRLRGQRNFVVSTEVDPSGRILMFAHMKIQRGGGDNIPRIYFHDDTDGTTGKMHVGFVGPHRYVRNTKS